MKKRYLYLDVMRIIAVFLVIFNHMPGYILYQSASGMKTWGYMFITMVTRINVPLFLMISGTLLLERVESYKTLLSKRASRFALVILIFELGIYLELAVISFSTSGQWDISITKFITGMLRGSLEGTHSYWYLYAYLGLVLMLPFLRKICIKLSKQDFILLLTIHFVMSSVLPMADCICSAMGIGRVILSGNVAIPLATLKQCFYPIIGFYIDRNVDVDKLSKKKMSILLFLTFVGIMVSCGFTYYEGIHTGFTQNYVQLFEYLTAICVFIFIKKICNHGTSILQKPKIGKIITVLGSLTFGIYLIDPYLQIAMYSEFEGIMKTKFPVLLVSVAWCLVSMLIGGLITFVLKKVPMFKKLI